MTNSTSAMSSRRERRPKPSPSPASASCRPASHRGQGVSPEHIAPSCIVLKVRPPPSLNPHLHHGRHTHPALGSTAGSPPRAAGAPGPRPPPPAGDAAPANRPHLPRTLGSTTGRPRAAGEAPPRHSPPCRPRGPDRAREARTARRHQQQRHDLARPPRLTADSRARPTVVVPAATSLHWNSRRRCRNSPRAAAAPCRAPAADRGNSRPSAAGTSTLRSPLPPRLDAEPRAGVARRRRSGQPQPAHPPDLDEEIGARGPTTSSTPPPPARPRSRPPPPRRPPSPAATRRHARPPSPPPPPAATPGRPRLRHHTPTPGHPRPALFLRHHPPRPGRPRLRRVGSRPAALQLPRPDPLASATSRRRPAALPPPPPADARPPSPPPRRQQPPPRLQPPRPDPLASAALQRRLARPPRLRCPCPPRPVP
nr:uncharacterized protein LOC127310714 [Lolium perenne]